MIFTKIYINLHKYPQSGQIIVTVCNISYFPNKLPLLLLLLILCFHALSPLYPYPSFSFLSFFPSFVFDTLSRHVERVSSLNISLPHPSSPLPRVTSRLAKPLTSLVVYALLSRYEQVVIRHFESASRNTIEDRSAGSIARPIFPSFFSGRREGKHRACLGIDRVLPSCVSIRWIEFDYRLSCDDVSRSIKLKSLRPSEHVTSAKGNWEERKEKKKKRREREYPIDELVDFCVIFLLG